MAHPINEVSSHELVPGQIYYGFSGNDNLRASFTEYWRNRAGYLMARFHNGIYNMSALGVSAIIHKIGDFPDGSSFRIWPDDHQPHIGFRFYKASRFTPKEKAEIKTRLVLRQRREYERGLTGSMPNGKWFPRDLVREIALRYLTDDRVGHIGQWKIQERLPMNYIKLGFSENDNEMLQDAEQAITNANMWEWMRTVDPGREGYAGCRLPEFNKITQHIKYSGHSGGSFGGTLRTMQQLAKLGREEFCKMYDRSA